jgi:hypothetical protein
VLDFLRIASQHDLVYLAEQARLFRFTRRFHGLCAFWSNGNGCVFGATVLWDLLTQSGFSDYDGHLACKQRKVMIIKDAPFFNRLYRVCSTTSGTWITARDPNAALEIALLEGWVRNPSKAQILDQTDFF